MESSPAKRVTVVLTHSTGGSVHLEILERLRQNGAVNAVAFRTVAGVNGRGELAALADLELLTSGQPD